MPSESSKKLTRKISSYTIDRDKAVTTNASTTISSIGLFLGLTFSTVISGQTTALLQDNYFLTSPVVSVIVNLTTIFNNYGLFLANNFTAVIPNVATGWFIGGFIAGIIYGKEGSGAPVYTIRLMGKTFIPLVMVLGIIYLMSDIESINILPMDPMVAFLIFFSILVVISIPLALIALIGYKFGLFIST